MSTEEVERKVDSEAEGTPGRNAAEVAEESEFESSGQESAVGGLLTDLSVGAIPSLSLAVLLFGGLVLAFAGAGLWVEATFGTYPTMVVSGLGAMVLSYVLAQVYARRGWI